MSLNGTYSFVGSGGVPISESDQVDPHYAPAGSTLFEGGARFRWFASRRGGLRVDVRGFAASVDDAMSIDISPSSKPGVPAGFFATTVGRTIVFSNTPTQQGTLSGAAITN